MQMRRLLIDDDSLISSQEALCFYTKANIVKYHKENMKKIKEILKKSSKYINTKYKEKNINLICTFLSKKLCGKEKIKR